MTSAPTSSHVCESDAHYCCLPIGYVLFACHPLMGQSHVPSLASNSCARLGLMALGALLAFAPLLEGGTTHLAAMIIRLLILSLGAMVLVRTIQTRILCWPQLRIGLPVALFLTVAGIAVWWSPYANQSQQWMMVLLCYAGLLYLLAAFVERWEDVAKLRTVLVGMALAQAILVFVQIGQWKIARPSGTFFNPNFLAGYLATVSVVVLASTCYLRFRLSRSWSECRALIRLLQSLGVLSALLWALVQTGSRGGALALLIGVALVVGLRFGRRGAIALLVVMFLGCLMPNPIRDRVIAEHGSNPETYTRLQMWKSTIHEIVEQPLGVGLGLYQYIYPRYAFPVEDAITRYGKVAQTPHNEYLQIGVELGLGGLGMFLWGILLVAREAVWLLRQRLTRQQRGLIVGICAGIVVILTQATVDSNLHEPALAILLTFCVAIVMVSRKLFLDDRQETRGERGKSFQPPMSRSCVIVAIRRPVLWGTIGSAVIGLLAVNAVRLGLAYQIYESGSRLAKQQQFESAIAKLQQAILLDPGKSLYHTSLAAAYFQLAQQTHDQAMIQASVEELQTAIALNPLDGRLHSLLGTVAASQVSSRHPPHMTKQDRLWLGQAVEAYERAAGLEPFSYGHRFELARLALSGGRPDEAERHVKRTVELEPNFLPGRELLFHLYMESGRRTEAQREYQEIVARQQRYRDRATTLRERLFLRADTARLARLLMQKDSAT